MPATNRLVQNAIWQYVQVSAAPVAGPQPRLAVGTGNTSGSQNKAGANGLLPGFVAEPDYHPSVTSYSPRNNPVFTLPIPRTINRGDDGLHALNPTFRAHDSIPGQRFFTQARRASNYQQMAFSPNFRQLLQYQQVRKYIVLSQTMQARVLSRNDYFFGYRVDPTIAANIGGFNALGSMGSA